MNQNCSECYFYRPIPGLHDVDREGCHYNYMANGEVNVKDIAEGMESVSIYCKHYLPKDYKDMTLEQYQSLAARTVDKHLPASLRERHGVYGLCSECGEVASLYQHAIQEGCGISREKLISELGDVLWFVAEIAGANGLTLAELAGANITKLRGRYPGGFNAERSKGRHEYGED